MESEERLRVLVSPVVFQNRCAADQLLAFITTEDEKRNTGARHLAGYTFIMGSDAECGEHPRRSRLIASTSAGD